MKALFTVLLALCLLVPVAVQAQEGTKYGTFSAIKMDEDVVDHVLTEGMTSMLKYTEIIGMRILRSRFQAEI